MAFRSLADAQASRRAVAGLMGLAERSGFLAATTDHGDLTPAVAGQAPLCPSAGGRKVPAPDLVLFGELPGVVIGVEVETRPFSRHYPNRSFVDVAKLRNNVEIQLFATTYARHTKDTCFDLEDSWRQKDIRTLIELHEMQFIDFVTSRTGETLLLLGDQDLDRLDALWRKLRGAV